MCLMSRTNIDIDDELMDRVMAWYGFPSKREAVHFALRELLGTGDPTDILELQGTGWEGDLDEMRGKKRDRR
jgi:Arc/MetJ family transcription regulator